jgi:hypothetical protein
VGGGAGGGGMLGEMEAHQEQLGRRSMTVVAGLKGRKWRQRGVEVRGIDAKHVVVKLGTDGGRRWRPVWRWFLDGEGDGSLTNGGSQSS